MDRTDYGEYILVDTVEGKYDLVEIKEIGRKIIRDAYDVDFDLIVEDSEGMQVYRTIALL